MLDRTLLALFLSRGWRAWKAFYAHISQDILEQMADELAKKYDVDGVPTSLADLGYLYVGLDGEVAAVFPDRHDF